MQDGVLPVRSSVRIGASQQHLLNFCVLIEAVHVQSSDSANQLSIELSLGDQQTSE
jgi:hypothetical protein